MDVPARHGLGCDESDLDDRRVAHRNQRAALHRECGSQLPAWRCGRRRSVGSGHARVERAQPAAATQLRCPARGAWPRSAMGAACATGVGQRSRRRCARGAVDDRTRFATRVGAAVSVAMHLAVDERGCDDHPFHRLDLFAVGGRVGISAGCDRNDRLVLAGTPRKRPRRRTGASAMMEIRKVPPATASRHADAREGESAALMLDVRHLPTFGFGHRSLMWWSTMGLMLIEGTVFAIGAMMYFYLRSLTPVWPLDAAPPALRWGTVNTVVLIASLWPNQLAKRAAERNDRAAARLWLSVCLACAAVFLVVRGLEFSTLNVS